jgi:hypothetical protein
MIRRLAEQDPSNAGWQRDLAVAQRKVGDVLQAPREAGGPSRNHCGCS